MMLYILICLCLALAGIAGMQFLYMVYLDRIDQERRKSINELERRNKFLAESLEEADLKIVEQNKVIQGSWEETEDIWADVIDER